MEDNIRGKIEIWEIDKLHNWKKNPRTILTDDFERLKKQITKLGQYKPLISTPDGEVIGGNMRLKALQSLGIKKVWVNIIEPKDENEKMEIALSDNDRAGFYDSSELANIIPNYQIDWKDYAVDFNIPQILTDLIEDNEKINEKEVDENIETANKCPKCGYEW